MALAEAFGCRVEEVFGRAGDASAGPEPALGDIAQQAPVWLARVGRRVLAYPVEPTAMGTIAHDVRFGGPEQPDGHSMETPPAPDPSKTLVIAGCDPAVGLLARAYQAQTGYRLIPLQRSSGMALDLLRRGAVHGAGVHFPSDGGQSGNPVRVGRELGPGHRLVRVATWEDGVAIGGGRRTSVASMLRSRVRWAPREPGSVARECLDRLLGGQAATLGRTGRVAGSHRAVAEVVRSGWAEAGVCVRLAAEEAGLQFIGVQQEDYDLCFSAGAMQDPRVLALVKVIRSGEYRAALAALPGYHTGETGELTDAAAN